MRYHLLIAKITYRGKIIQKFLGIDTNTGGFTGSMREWLVEKRKGTGLRQNEVAKKAGISQSYYAQLENGSRGKNISGANAKKIARVLGFKWTWFYDEDRP